MAKYTSKAFGLKISIANVLTTIAQATQITGPDSEVETVDVTALDSSVGKEHMVTGYTDAGTITGSVFFDPVGATHTAFTSYLAAPASISMSLALPGTATWTFTGIPTKFTPKLQVGQAVQADFAAQLTGVVTGW